jgi:UDP-N-acetylglucosamine 4,6-dehydratase
MIKSTVLITGAGGTVGRLLIDHYLKDSSIRIKALDRSEMGMAKLLIAYENNPRIEPILGDLLDLSSFRGALSGCDTVIHCAALKHVTIGKHFPGRQAYENVTSFYNLINEARRSGVKKFLFCSTDKAAQPTGVMGSTKHLLEHVCRDAATDSFATGSIRFANILGSNGSLLQVLYDRLQNGKEFTLRDERMTRYFLRSHEVIELASYALAHMQKGEIYIFSTPSALIKDVVGVVFDHYESPRENLKIAVTPSYENIHERLISHDEKSRTRRNGRFLIVGGSGGKELTSAEFERAFSSSVGNLTKAEIKDMLYGN